MGYKSKNLSGSRRKATTAMVNQQDKLFAAQDSLKTFQRENKELTELTKNISDNTQGSVFLAQFLKNRSYIDTSVIKIKNEINFKKNRKINIKWQE